METLVSLLALIIVIVISSMLSKKFVRVPLALLQIVLGAIVSWAPIHLALEFEPEVFMICLIAPLLFGDARVTSRKELWEYKKPIILMAAGLVIITVVGIGYVIHYLIPSMPLPAAFALAAVLSPTDAVAVKSITKGLPLPKSLMPILEGESLLNDAAGIVCFKVALAVVITGVFSAPSAALNFAFVAIGGVVLGLLSGYLFVKLRLVLRQHGFEEVNSLVAIQLITPFIIYIVAEELKVSGVLAVVAAGIIHGIERDRLQQTTTKLQITSTTTWSVLSYILNGFVFVLLGFLLPDVISGLLESNETSMLTVLGMIVLITASLFVIRYIWVYVLHRDFVRNELSESNSQVKEPPITRGRYALLAATCGIHGTVTLATALSIPYDVASGIPFPFRNTILFIAAGVILLSLVFATFALPLMIRKEQQEETPETAMSVEEATKQIIPHTIQLLKSEIEPDNKLAVYSVIRDLEEQYRYALEGKAFKISTAALNEYQEIGRAAERDKLATMISEGQVPPHLAKLCQFLYQPQDKYTLRSYLWRIWFHIKLRQIKRRLEKFEKRSDSPRMQVRTQKLKYILQELHRVEGILQRAAVEAIHKHTTPDHRYEALLVIQHFTRRIRQDRGNDINEEQFLHQLKMVQLRSIQIKRDLVQQLEEHDQITAHTRFELLQAINYDEQLLLDN